MRSSKHYAWLLRGRLEWQLIRIAREEAAPLHVGKIKLGRYSYWLVKTDAKDYLNVYLRGNSKQRRQQRRAIERFLARAQGWPKVPLEWNLGTVEGVRLIRAHPLETVSEGVSDAAWSDLHDGGNQWRGPKP